ncbi:hypothetical protein [Enterococcus sp. DIV0876]|uniref:hypothetical protein n=1 Tax=Enterococcus sp. DIV0876 TaxID=2774633 RepID=UPI003D2FEB02
MTRTKRGIIATVHNRRNDLLEVSDVSTVLDFLANCFEGVFLAISDVTDPLLTHLLNAHHQCKTMIIPANGAGDARRKAVRAAKEAYPALTSFQLCDFDRLLTWQTSFPDELAQISQLEIGKETYCILGRTPQAFDSHPQAWRVTEALVNQVAQACFQLEDVDITAGSEIFSASLIDVFLKDNHARLNDGEWPRKVLTYGGNLMYHACDGLCYADRNRDGLSDDPMRQLMGRLQLAAAITKSLYEERV